VAAAGCGHADRPRALSGQAVRAAVERMIERYGSDDRAARMASEFGDHPDLAVRRMLWVRRIMSALGV
jgi:UDP:flavonoid glycosyltransferase YjiC (YdhE family)